jgi:hypothetical protein
MPLNRLAGFAALSALGSCGLFTDACACTWPLPAARAIGTVIFSEGGPAAGATVLASTWRPPCGPVPNSLFPMGETTTNAQGTYRLEFGAAAEGLQCARLTARLGAAEVSQVVTVEARLQGNRPLDSVRVDLTLP